MNRAVRGKFLKDESYAISDHLRNHVHLTNCIHLKNHMHRHSPILSERSLMRDLIVLQRSRSLRDPSTSPPSWHSPSVMNSMGKKLEKDGVVHGGRRSLGIERRGGVRILSASSPPLSSLATSKLADAEVRKLNGSGNSEQVRMNSGRDDQTMKGEGSSRKNHKSDLSGFNEKHLQDVHELGVVDELVPGKEVPRQKKTSRMSNRGQDNYLKKTLSEQLKQHPMNGEDVTPFHHHERRTREEKTSEVKEVSTSGYCNGLNRVKKRKFRGVRRARASIGSMDTGAHNELSVASNSLPQASLRPKYYVEEEEEADAELDISRAPRNGCGIPWNWSRIHDRGKTILDIAGRSLSCGLSDSRLRKGEGQIPQGQRNISDAPVTSDHSGSSTKSDSEALPLLIQPSGSQESNENAVWARECFGELGIFADHSLKHDQDFDLASEARSGAQRNSRGYNHGRHRSLTQKYMPKTFKDLVGQSLVAQALSNAVLRRKVGLLYVFYGPHGTGKTSCARVFARALNCLSPEHPKPCGVCNSCVSHDLGKSRNVQEVGPIGNFDSKSIMSLLEKMNIAHMPSQYRVLIVDDCDTLPPDSWSAISKVTDRAPRRLVFVLVCTSLDHLPHILVSRCQKFFFPKLKDADIIYTLQWIATKEDIEIDKEALKLIASRSDGSLRDAEMTLEQLSLLGQKISVPLVQELVGLISDEKLVDLLDLALSADTVNTVKSLREIMEAGVEPLALMSQLATIITDILAGSYVFTRERLRRKFFCRQKLSKADMEKLRQALKTLSEAEKQLRMSNDKLTWLTAALLQLAPDQQYTLPTSSADTSFNHSPVVPNNVSERDVPKKYNGGRKHVGASHSQTSALSTDMPKTSGGKITAKGRNEVEELWLDVLEKIQSNTVKQFMRQEGKLISVLFGAAPAVQLMFSSHVNEGKAEQFRVHILQAFESVLGSPVTIEIRYEPRKDKRAEAQVPLVLSASEKTGSENHRRLSKDRLVKGVGSTHSRRPLSDPLEMRKSEIVEIVASPTKKIAELEEKGLESVWVEEAESSHHQSTLGATSERGKTGEQPQRQSLVRSKVSLAHVIQQAEGCTQRNGWSNRKAVSIAEKLEQENLRLEPRSRSLLCWKASRISRGKVKLPQLRIRTRRPHSLLKLVTCGRCICVKSPRSH